MSAVTMYCFAHSGATTSVYRAWRPPDGLVLVPVERPGRGVLARTQPRPDLEDLIDSCAETIRSDAAARGVGEWIGFGHSFGSVLCLLTAARLVDRPPVRLALSAGLPPSAHEPGNDIAGWDDARLCAHLVEIGATARELLEGPMRHMILNHFRQDHHWRGQFHRFARTRVAVPMTVFGADEDQYAAPWRLAAWANHSSSETALRTIGGGHFALMRDPSPLWESLSASWKEAGR